MSRGAPSNEWTARQPIRATAVEDPPSPSDALLECAAAFERVKEAERNAKRVRGTMAGLDVEAFDDEIARMARGRVAFDDRAEENLVIPSDRIELELEQQIATLRRTAERLSERLVASTSRLVSEVARARKEGRADGRAEGRAEESAYDAAIDVTVREALAGRALRQALARDNHGLTGSSCSICCAVRAYDAALAEVSK